MDGYTYELLNRIETKLDYIIQEIQTTKEKAKDTSKENVRSIKE